MSQFNGSGPLQSTFTLGFLGSGQLARMSALQAFRYGISVAAFSDRTELEPLQKVTPHSRSGSFEDLEELIQFARECDVLTLENEFIRSDLLLQVREKSGTPIWPSPETFSKIENKRIEKQTFEAAGIPVTPYQLMRSENDLTLFGEKQGWPYLLKSSKGGYDGYGNATVRNPEEAVEAFRKLGGERGHEILAEAFVDFTHELAVQVARNERGIRVFPCCETIQENHICVAVRSPAPIDKELQKQAQELAVRATETIDGRGIFAYEFFLTREKKLILNESAPRPHNSGHYTIEGCITSQFENHIRAVLNLPLGPTTLRRPAAVMANLLGTRNEQEAHVEGADPLLQTADAHLHIYGKLESKVGRKMGHLTLLGENMDELYPAARSMADSIEL